MGSRLSRRATSLLTTSGYAVATEPRPAGCLVETKSLLSNNPRWTRWDLICISLAFVLTLSLAAAMGHGRIFWEDELLGWMLLRDPSWKHMLSGWLKGVDGGGILFYLTGRFWFKVFGPSVLSFRMYSATGFAVALAALWASARRFYGPAVVAFALLLTWFTSPVLVQALCEGRFYGLVMGSDAVAVYLFLYLAERTRLSRTLYVLVFVAHACLVMSHILGVVYSSLIVLTMIIHDLTKRRLRSGLYLTAIAPDLLLIPCLPAIRASAHVGRPHFWSEQPTVAHFFTDFSGFSATVGILILVGLTILVAHLKSQGMLSTLAVAVRQRSAIHLYTAVIFGLPALFLVEGFFAAPLCTPRYLLPTVVGTTFLIAEIITDAAAVLSARARRRPPLQFASWAVFLAILLLYDFIYLPQHNPLRHDYTWALTSQLPRHNPVVCEDAFSFIELISLQHSSDVLYTFVLDWKNSVDPKAPRLEVTQYHLMENWKNHGYFSGSIKDRDEFLRITPFFYSISFSDISESSFRAPVVVERYPQAGNPIHVELARTPGYRVDLANVITLREHVVHVWRICRGDVPQCR
jgi:hypothetical protein